jgi:Skp family chaperone for outer membrane proteins
MDEEKSLSLEEFENTYVKRLNAISDVLNTSPDAIPDGVEQFELMNTITIVTAEMRKSLSARVPEITRLQKELAATQASLKKTQETNQQLNLRVSRQLERELAHAASGKEEEEKEKPPLSFAQIKHLIDGM